MSIRVLIVEDCAVVRQLLEHVVGTDPRFHVVGSVATAERALAVLPRLKPDVVSMDMNLPGMSGLEAITQIMQKHPQTFKVFKSHGCPDMRRGVFSLSPFGLSTTTRCMVAQDITGPVPPLFDVDHYLTHPMFRQIRPKLCPA